MNANCVDECLQIVFFTDISFLLIAGLIRVQNNFLVVLLIVGRYESVICVGNSRIF